MRRARSVGWQSLIEDAAMPRNPEIRSVTVDEKGRVASDLVCPNCRYNLRGLLRDGACPECSFAVGKAILAANDPRQTNLQIFLSVLAMAVFWVAMLSAAMTAWNILSTKVWLPA